MLPVSPTDESTMLWWTGKKKNETCKHGQAVYQFWLKAGFGVGLHEANGTRSSSEAIQLQAGNESNGTRAEHNKKPLRLLVRARLVSLC